jgi:hypothetical protein
MTPTSVGRALAAPLLRTGIVAAVTVLACTRASAGDQLLPVPTPPILLRLDGTIEPTPEAAAGKGFTVVSLGFPGRATDERRSLAAEDARTVGPDTALDGKDVLNMVAPVRPNLLVTGPKALVDQLLDAAPGTKVRTEGLVTRGSRTYHLRSVRVGPDAWAGAR